MSFYYMYFKTEVSINMTQFGIRIQTVINRIDNRMHTSVIMFPFLWTQQKFRIDFQNSLVICC